MLALYEVSERVLQGGGIGPMKIRMHENHPASCLCCVNLRMTYESTGYCSSCASTEGALECLKNKFNTQTGYFTLDIGSMGQDCEEYKAREK